MEMSSTQSDRGIYWKKKEIRFSSRKYTLSLPPCLPSLFIFSISQIYINKYTDLNFRYFSHFFFSLPVYLYAFNISSTLSILFFYSDYVIFFLFVLVRWNWRNKCILTVYKEKNHAKSKNWECFPGRWD